MASAPVMASVPRLWTDETVVCLAGGPSLTVEDVEACRDRARVIAIKDAVRLAPWAEVLYSCGDDASSWWQRNVDLHASFTGLRYTLDPKAAAWAQVLRDTGMTGLETDPSGLRTGKNSGYQAINLAVHLGARRIVLLGYDMQPDRGRHHWFGAHPNPIPPPYAEFLPCFDSIVEPLRALGVEVVNATRRTALTCFPCVPLLEALA